MSDEIIALVLMPFDQSFDDIYKLGIRAAANDAGMDVTRIDEQIFHSEGIVSRICAQIDAAPLIIADMSGKNPNVFYEVGYAHARDKICILITDSVIDIPFDLRDRRHIIYGNSIDTLKVKLLADLLAIKPALSPTEKPLVVSLREVSADITRDKNDLSKIRAWPYVDVVLEFDIENRVSRKRQEIEAIYFYSGPNWRFTQEGQECPSAQSDLTDYSTRHLFRTQMPQMSKGTFTTIKVSGRKFVPNLDPQTFAWPYPLKGGALVRVITANGSFDYPISISYDIDEIPF